MPSLVELGTSKRNGSRSLLHRVSPRISSGAPIEFNNDALLSAEMSNPYFGITRYVRPIDSLSRFWLNRPAADRRRFYEHCIGIGDVSEQRTNRTEQLRDAPAGGVQRRTFSHRRRRRAIGPLLRKGLRRPHSEHG